MRDVIALEMRGLPRDAVVVTTMQGVAEHAESIGRRALLGGRDWRNWRDLRDRWSELSHRVGTAHVIGPEWLCDAVTHFCHITAVNRDTSVRRARRWAEHWIRNLHWLADRPHAMRGGAAKGRAAIIVGAGPSLDRNCAALEASERDAITIGVNAGSKAVPCDVVLCVESNDIANKLGPGLGVFGLGSPPALLASREMHPIWTGELAFIAEELTGTSRLPTSGSGTTSAVSLARLWGCEPIVLVGQDLAYTGGGVYAERTGHGADRISEDGRFDWQSTGGIPRPDNPLPEQDTLERVPAWGGQGTVLSGMPFRTIRHWLSAAAECVAPVRCVNATEGGARIDGWEEAPLSEVLHALPQRNGTGLDFGAPQCRLDRIQRWLRDDAPRELGEIWSYSAVNARLEQHRRRAPYRVPAIEAWVVRRMLRDVDAVVADAEREIRKLVEAVCSRCG